MKVYKFTVAEHEEYGTMGFKPSWYPAGDPLEGMAVAHDILEHFPHDSGSAEEEYQALGASLWIRGCGGYKQNGTPEENIAADLPMVWSIQGAVRSCGLSKESEVIEQARAAVTHWMREKQYIDRENKPTDADQENVARWIAKGFQRARKRYRKHNPYTLCYRLFEPIEEQADKALKYAEEGMVLTVRVDFINLEIRVSCDYPEEEYAY